MILIGSKNLKDELQQIGALQTHASNLHTSVKKKKKKLGAGKNVDSEDIDEIEVVGHKGKKALKVHVKHEFPPKDTSQSSLSTSETSLSTKSIGISGMSELEKLSRQRDTLNQLLLLTTEDTAEWKDLKNKIKANLYRELDLLEDAEK